MNQHLQSILDFIQQDESLSADEKNALSKSLKNANNDLEITAFKLGQIEKVKRTTAILLEETLEELEEKRNAVEAQNRELQIESSLERVRTVAMSMKKPDDMLFVCRMISDQLQQLGFKEIRNVQTVIIYENKHEYLNYQYFAPYGKNSIEIIDYRLHPDVLEFTEKMLQSADAYYTKTFEGEALKVWREYRKQTNQLPDPKLDAVTSSHYYFYSIGSGALGVTTYAPLSEEQIGLFRRFRNVFDLAYRRFMDIEKAEAQAREAQIELGLERVRAKAMAMQKSDDLAHAVAIIFEELDKLSIGMLRCGIGILNKEARSVKVWAATSDKNVQVQLSGEESMDTHPLLRGAFNAWLKQQEYSYELEGEDLTAYYKAQASANFPLPDSQVLTGNAGLRQYYFLSTFQAGGLFAFSDTPFPEEAKKVMNRFSGVLNLTYKRFADLQKAEAQTREAQIEAALERVRSRTLAMQKTDELLDAAELVSKELSFFEIESMNVSYAFVDEEEKYASYYSGNPVDGKFHPFPFVFPHTETDVMRSILSSWKKQEPFFVIELDEEATLKHQTWVGEHIQQLITKSNVDIPFSVEAFLAISPKKAVIYSFNFTKGYLFNIGGVRLTPLQQELMLRFTKVFEQTYIRFLDLQKAEAQTREAIKASSLDRIRAEIASMRTAADLQRITPSIWKELTILGLPFFRCGIFIVNEKEEKIHSYLSTPDGQPLAVLHLNFTSSEVTRHITDYWRQQKVYTEHWNREQFITWVESLIGQGQIKAVNIYQAGNEPPELLSLQFVPFIQGMLYVGSAGALSATQIELVKALADAFSVAYARYEDFTKLEEAKDQVEKTLKELKATQSQLIQSEKMASLGELTAGIAHEIQNPLNFVNNFSEVSAEMMDEMEREFIAGNQEEGVALVSDIKLNLQKILHHGKRADDIVKGMLQHTRSSTGKKEPTDVNALADEYLRLAYHGLRAKDKTFNATLETDFDQSIGKINIVPQDIARVILNLLNNAFYAVTEKKKQQPEHFEPRVLVSIKKMDNKVLVSVKDNGHGIARKNADKIFQPFFTTKPAGQGTGLGLSLSYDIIKAHGGELQVKNKEGEGAEFRFLLPV